MKPKNPRAKCLTEINKRQKELVNINKNLLNNGKKFEYDCNCNELRGMAFVLQKLDKYDIL